MSSLVFNNNMPRNITNINNNFDFKSHANSIRMNYINSGINRNKNNKNKSNVATATLLLFFSMIYYFCNMIIGRCKKC